MPPQQSCANCKFFLVVTVHTWRTDKAGRGLCLYNPPKVVENRVEFATDDEP